MQAPARRRGAACELASFFGAGPAPIIARRLPASKGLRMARSELAPRSAGFLGTAIQLVILLLLLGILAAAVFVLFSVAALTAVPSQVGGVASQASRALSSAQQAVQNATDPNHPPVGLAYDAELTAIDTWHVGDGLPGGTDYVLTVKSIQRRANADSPETAL